MRHGKVLKAQGSGGTAHRSTETSINVGAIASHQWVCDAIYCAFPTREDFVFHDLLILAAGARARRHTDGSRGSNANLTDLFVRSDVPYHAVHRIALVRHPSKAAADDSFSFLDDNRGDNGQSQNQRTVLGYPPVRRGRGKQF